jgi:osmotically-inducible protein OsmY
VTSSRRIDRSVDRAIHQHVLDRLRVDPVVDELDVGVEVDDGVVTLTGTVSTWKRRDAAARAAHEAPGVRDVANDIEVRLPGMRGRTDADVAAAVRAALDDEPALAAAAITTTVSGGVVVLTGTVGEEAAAEVAEACLRDIPIVRGIVNRLSVRASDEQSRGGA